MSIFLHFSRFLSWQNIIFVVGMKTTKITWFSNPNENKSKLSSKFISWNKNKTRTNKNPIKFHYKNKQNNVTTRKCSKLVLNKLKAMGNSTFIYTPWELSSKKFIKELPIYKWPMFTHVWTMNELRLNWKWIRLD